MTKVSVIITTYGGGRELARAVDSVLAQTYRGFELIVVDDNGVGTDAQKRTAQLISRYGDSVKYIAHDTNRNGAAARNTGFKNSVGEYIMFLDDDDEYTPERIEKQLALLEETSFGASYCSYIKRTADGAFYEKVTVKKSGGILYPTLMHSCSPTTDSMMIRREHYAALGGFDQSFVRHQDWELTARLADRCEFIAMRDIGLIVNLQFRNAPRDPQLIKAYRQKYLEKTAPQLQKLGSIRQKRVLAENLYDVSMQYLKSGGLPAFIKDYRTVGLGIFGIEFLFRRAYSIITRKIRSLWRGK